MTSPVPFDRLARIPSDGDNVAITTRRVERGTEVGHEGRSYRLGHTILEGHRFALRDIGQGEALLSWGLPFGLATRDIAAGNSAGMTTVAALYGFIPPDDDPHEWPADYRITLMPDPLLFAIGVLVTVVVGVAVWSVGLVGEDAEAPPPAHDPRADRGRQA